MCVCVRERERHTHREKEREREGGERDREREGGGRERDTEMVGDPLYSPKARTQCSELKAPHFGIPRTRHFGIPKDRFSEYIGSTIWDAKGSLFRIHREYNLGRQGITIQNT